MNKGRKAAFTKTNGGFFLVSLALSVVLLLAVSLASAAIAYSSDDPTGKIGIYSLVSLIISAAACGFGVSRFKGEGGIAMAALVALSISLLMMTLGAILGGGRLGGSAVMNYLCYFGVAVIFSVLGKKREKRHRRR